MNIWRVVLFCVCLTSLHGQDDILDRVQEKLTFSAMDAQLRGRVSGLVDLELYSFEQPPPGLIFAEESPLFNPRLTVYLDGQYGPKVYGFVQARADRGFDPSDASAEVRLDEYALRITPWEDGRFNLQIGQFGTVVGSWVKRHSSWDNPFVTAPLAYEELTGMWDSEAVRTPDLLLKWAHLRPAFATEYGDKDLRLPLIWGPSYATGAAISGKLGHIEYAAEVKNGSLSSRPEYWRITRVGFEHPTISGRLGYRPNEMWDIGISGSSGSYLDPSARGTEWRGFGRGDYREKVIGADVSFAWHYLQLWAEVYQGTFEIPWVRDVRLVSYFIEAKYKLTPQLFLSLRWNEQTYGNIQDSTGAWVPWGRDTWRIDVAPTYRLTPHTQLKLQWSLKHETFRSDSTTQLIAAQATMRF
jgi:hypothetical protein